MNSLEANIRENSTKGQLNAIRKNGNVPAIIYGGKDENQKISISKKLLKSFNRKRKFFIKYNYIKCKWKTSKCLTERSKVSYYK